MASDPFDDVLNLEDQYYDQGYQQGYDDGYQAGKIEGRSVGLKTGYEKFLEAGRMQGKAIVWANRISNLRAAAAENSTELKSQPQDASATATDRRPLPALPGNPRLEKNVTSLYALVEPGTLSTENNDEAVNDFDDRVKRAQGKLKIVERSVGEDREKDAPQSLRQGRNEI
ncbi:hypothetical protein JX266_008692 [Neoarthrinium moseri]|nr:hypothetical protein JX266_008692 [Neoarthrinium moseri]